MNAARVVYADVPEVGRLAAQRTTTEMVAVWRPGGKMLGYYKLDRFEGGKVTAATVRKLFTPEPAPEREDYSWSEVAERGHLCPASPGWAGPHRPDETTTPPTCAECGASLD